MLINRAKELVRVHEALSKKIESRFDLKSVEKNAGDPRRAVEILAASLDQVAEALRFEKEEHEQMLKAHVQKQERLTRMAESLESRLSEARQLARTKGAGAAKGGAGRASRSGKKK